MQRILVVNLVGSAFSKSHDNSFGCPVSTFKSNQYRKVKRAAMAARFTHLKFETPSQKLIYLVPKLDSSSRVLSAVPPIPCTRNLKSSGLDAFDNAVW